MPRVHGIETQRRRHGGGGTNATAGGTSFSLSTPFSNFAGRAPPSTTTTGTSTSNNHTARMMEDDLSFHGTQPSQRQHQDEEEEEEVPGTQNPNFPTTRPTLSIPIAVRGGDAMTAQKNKHNAGAPSSVAPPVVHHPSFLNRGRGGGTNNNNGSTIITKITPRDKRQLDGMEFGTSSFSVSNITPRERGNTVANVAASSSGGATTSSSKVASSHTANGVTYHDSRTMNRQYYQPATVMGGGRMGGASSSIAAPAAMYSHSTTTITSPTNTKTTSTKVNDGKLRATSGGESGLLNHGTSNNAVGVVATASTTTNEEVHAKTNKNDTETASMLKSNQNDNDDKIKYKDGMDDDTDDSTSNTQNDDDDEEQSVDLLLNDDDDDNNNNNGGVSIPNNNVGHHHRISNNASSSSSSSLLSLSPISPATQTLDRLSMIGTQDGGAELCVELNANAVRTPMREKEEKAKSPPEKTAAANATSTEATTTAVVSTKKDDRSKVISTPSFQSIATTGARTSRTTTTTTSTTPPDIMKGIEPGVDFLPGATMFAKYRGDRLSQAQMIKKRGKGDDMEYYIQYLGLEKTEEEEACCCWVSVKHLYEINPQTKRLFRQYGTTGTAEDGIKSLEGKFGFKDSNQQGGEEEELESSTTTPLTKQQRCIRSLKKYFMSTQNSAQYAENKLNRSSGGMELPLVTFCHHCNNNHNNTSLSQLPHHGLCPKHEDFFVSGSYEILNLIVDGNLLGCNACIYHFENGRPNKQLVHLENCKRYKAKGSRVVVGKKGRKAETSSSFGSVGGGAMSLTQSSASNGAKKQGDFPSSNNRGDTADKAGNGQGDETEKQRSSNNKNAGSHNNNDGKQESPELSDYEKLRLRNIQRNEARLAALGLLVPSNKKSVNNNKKSNNKEGFLSRNDSNNDGESKKGRSKGRKKQQQQQQSEAQKRTQPKRHKQKNGDDDQIQRRPALTEKENSSVSNQKQQHADDVRKNNGDFAPAAKAKGKSIESASLVEAAKSGCRKCTLEWQTDTKDPTKSHDSCCPRGNSSRLSTTQQQQKPKGSKKSSSRTPPPQTSSMVQKKSSQVTPRLSPALQEARHTGAATTMANTSSSVSQGGQSMLMDVDSGLFQSALQKGFSAAYLRGKTEEELLALLSSGRDSQQSLQPILPPFIRDFIDEADRNSEIPAPRGTKWLSCPNPWGKIGHEEGDFVVISPFQSESAADMVSVFHQGPNGSIPKRFVANPLEEGSPYHETHRSPARKGYSVLRLTRDRMGLRPWGFTVRLHEFGGACLVDSIEPLSPAEAAEDISGWTDKDTPFGLQLHDMVICVNGKSVGCMTEAELQIDLDICGSEMMLVVARFDIEGNTNQNMTLEDLAMDWNDIGAVAPSRKKVVCFDDEESSAHRSELSRRPNFGMRNVSSQDCRPGSHGDDDDSNEEEIESDDDVADKTEDSLHRTHRLTSELESKSDEQLMEKLIEITGSRNWNKVTDCPLAKLLAKRGCLAAAKDESVQRLSCDSGGVTKDQMIEWMSRSDTFQQYKQIMRTKWSERHFSKHFIEALKDAGYTKISGGNKTRWSLPEDTVSRKVREQVVSSQEYQPDEEESDNRKQGSRKVDNVVSEFESKTDEELMEMLREGIKSGECAQLARVLAQRACLTAAQDENIQELNNVSGGVTKAQILEWMDRSDVFKGYKEMVRTQTKEESFMKRLTEALTSCGYVRFGTGPNTRWALPEDIVPRVDVDAKQSAASELFESKTDEELMEMLSEGIKSGDWIQLAKVLAQRACLAAAQDENIQELNNVSGGLTKAQIINWINGSKTFQRYEQMVRTKWSETSFQNKIGDALRSAGYVRFGGGINTRYELPEDTEPRVDSGVRPNNSRRKLIKSVGSTAGKRKRESDTFAQHKKQFHQYSDESSHNSSEDEGEGEEDDDNPWLGCVCGRTHPAPIQVFWIQCGACDAWHNVAEDCVGFSEEAADTLDDWFCWSCNPPCPGMDL